MAEPAYSFTLASVEDNVTLNCRIYRPSDFTAISESGYSRVKGAVLAHPYVPLGGCYDDPVVLSVAETLLSQGYVVGTFNFRGAGGSAGKTTWTGRAETEDYVTIAGFMVYYLHFLRVGSEIERPATAASTKNDSCTTQAQNHIELLLAGYSYGSLVLAKLPPPSSFVQRFQGAELGTSAAETVMRARALAGQTQRLLKEQSSPAATRPRGRSLKPDDATSLSTAKQRAKASPMTVGGEETDPAQRRSSRDSRRSADVIRKSVEMPRKIKEHLRRHSGQGLDGPSTESDAHALSPTTNAAPTVEVRYLLISPVLLPFTNILCPPGPPSFTFGVRRKEADESAGALFLRHPTLAVFGSTDTFTASRRLRAWAERQAKDSTTSNFDWMEVEGAGHFWREHRTLRTLQGRIASWLDDSSST